MGSCRESLIIRHTHPRSSWERSHLRPYEVTWVHVTAMLGKLSENNELKKPPPPPDFVEKRGLLVSELRVADVTLDWPDCVLNLTELELERLSSSSGHS